MLPNIRPITNIWNKKGNTAKKRKTKCFFGCSCYFQVVANGEDLYEATEAYSVKRLDKKNLLTLHFLENI
jgi:hypothetical protein